MMYTLAASHIDKSLPISVNRQLRGLMELQLAHGGLPPGSRLPSVREMADRMGIAVMTVSQVYRQLADSGLIDIRRGLGAFTPERGAAGEAGRQGLLRARIGTLLQHAEDEGVPFAELIQMINAQAQLGLKRPLKLALVGPFRHAMEHYAARLQPFLHPRDRLDIHEMVELQQDAALLAECRQSDAVLVVANREAEVRRILGAMPAPLLPMKLELSAATVEKLRLVAAGDVVIAVASVPDYAASLRPTILSVAPGLAAIRTHVLGEEGLAERLRDCDTVVYSNGADSVIGLAGPKRAIELSYTPDLAAFGELILPRLADLRRQAGSGDREDDAMAATG